MIRDLVTSYEQTRSFLSKYCIPKAQHWKAIFNKIAELESSGGGGANMQAGDGIEFDTTTNPGTTIIQTIQDSNALKTEYREVLFSNIQNTDTEVDIGLSNSSNVIATIPKLMFYNGFSISVGMTFTYTVLSNVGTFIVNDFLYEVNKTLMGLQNFTGSDLSGTLSLGLYDKNGNLVQEQSNIAIGVTNLVAFSNIDADDTNLAPYSIQLTDNTNLSINGKAATFHREDNEYPLTISDTNSGSSQYGLNMFNENYTSNTELSRFPFEIDVVFNSSNNIDLQASTIPIEAVSLFDYINEPSTLYKLEGLRLVIFYN